LAVFGAFLLVFFHIGWACGWFEKVGLGVGFALASDMREVQRGMDGIALRQVSQDLFEAKSSECEATNKGARAYFQRRVLTLSREYQAMARAPAVIPPCVNG
jgi:hypothetical protein